MACYFCQRNTKIDYRNAKLLSNFISGLYKIKPRKKTGLCARHQREIAKTIKRAREMGFLPYSPK